MNELADYSPEWAMGRSHFAPRYTELLWMPDCGYIVLMPNQSDEFTSLQAVIQALQPLDADARARIIAAVATFLQIRGPEAMVSVSAARLGDLDSSSPRATSYPAFSASDEMSPKEFLFQKQPRSDVERIAALAYYLTHYRDIPHFKTLDLSKLNTEAAQPKFANTANSASNAVKQGYLVPSTKGMRQLSAVGERFVAALPDRDAARATMANAKPRRKPRKTTLTATSATPAGDN